jgi:peroxiredoxin
VTPIGGRARERAGAVGVAALVAGGALYALLAAERAPAPLGEGMRAPELALPRLGDGATVRLADLRGRVVLVNFWATWCKPCEDEMPAMERLYGALRGEGFELLAVSVDVADAEVEAFRARLGLGFPILRDPDRGAATRWQSLRFPESWLVDRAGRIAARFIGPRDWDAPEYAARIRALLAAGSG